MPHFFINSTDVSGATVIVKDENNFKHISKSLRAKCGEKLLLIDENHIQYETIIEKITQNDITVKIKNSYPSKRKLGFDLYLAQSPLKSDAQTFIVEKATELGVSGIYPIYTDNCAVKKDVITKKIPKWQKIMYEASKQCERADIPVYFDLTDIETLCSSGNFDCIIAFCERIATTTLKEFILRHGSIFNNNKILFIIGPEGGFSQKEFEYFKLNSIPMLTLGNLILKAETAVVVCLGNIIYEYNNFRFNKE